jgi:hypothetical protein
MALHSHTGLTREMLPQQLGPKSLIHVHTPMIPKLFLFQWFLIVTNDLLNIHHLTSIYILSLEFGGFSVHLNILWNVNRKELWVILFLDKEKYSKN